MKPVRIFRHHEWIGAGYLLEMLKARGIPFEVIPADHASAVVRDPANVSGLVFLGAEYSVNDPFPWIRDELALIKNAIGKGVPVIGHCFGAQLISKALGGTVASMPAQEIGWHKAEIADTHEAREWLGEVPTGTPMLYWHGENFTLPPGSVALMGTAFQKNQAFAIGRNVVGTGAHLEVTPDIVRDWVNIRKDEMPPPSATTQTGTKILEDIGSKIRSMRQAADTLYNKWLTYVTAYGAGTT